MLVNNFKPLISFYEVETFKNVLGDTINKKDFLAGNHYQGGTPNATGRDGCASNSRYDYAATTNTNSCTQETGLYRWVKIVDVTDNTAYNTKTYSNMAYRKNGFVLFVGSGNTAPTVEDYKLDTALELTVLGASCTHSSNGTTLVTRTFQNNTVEAVTVKEIGCYVFAQSMGSTSNTSQMHSIVMVGRIVLDAPVTLEVGEAYTFQYTIDMSNITLNGAGA